MQQVGDEIGVDKSTMHRLEHGKCHPEEDTLRNLAAFYDLSPGMVLDLIYAAGKKAPNQEG